MTKPMYRKCECTSARPLVVDVATSTGNFSDFSLLARCRRASEPVIDGFAEAGIRNSHHRNRRHVGRSSARKCPKRCAAASIGLPARR